jgi:hypothetical protein
MNIDTFNFSYFKDKNKFANIELDALLSQDVTLTNIISEHPLETGEILNDAIHNQPLELNFTAVISDMPQNTLEELKSVVSDVTALFSKKELATSKSLRAWQELYALWKAKQLVTISSPIQHDVFEDMGIKNIKVSLSSEYALTFTVSLKQVLISENITKFNLAPEVGKQSIRL